MGGKKVGKQKQKNQKAHPPSSICDECEKKRERNLTREFWIQLSVPKMQLLCQVDKHLVLKELRTQHKHTCSCPTCGKRRTMFDSEVKIFEEYLQELECIVAPTTRASDPTDLHTWEDFPFGNSLIVRDSKISLAAEYFKDGGRRFAEIMARCSELYPEDDHASPNQYPFPSDFHEFATKARRYYRSCMGSSESETEDECEEEEESGEDDECSLSDEDLADEEAESDEDDDNPLHRAHSNGALSSRRLREYRIQETRLFFQVYVARLFAHNVKVAYREVVARANQLTLLADLEREELREQRERSKKLEAKKREKGKPAERTLKKGKAEKPEAPSHKPTRQSPKDDRADEEDSALSSEGGEVEGEDDRARLLREQQREEQRKINQMRREERERLEEERKKRLEDKRKLRREGKEKKEPPRAKPQPKADKAKAAPRSHVTAADSVDVKAGGGSAGPKAGSGSATDAGGKDARQSPHHTISIPGQPPISVGQPPPNFQHHLHHATPTTPAWTQPQPRPTTPLTPPTAMRPAPPPSPGLVPKPPVSNGKHVEEEDAVDISSLLSKLIAPEVVDHKPILAPAPVDPFRPFAFQSVFMQPSQPRAASSVRQAEPVGNYHLFDMSSPFFLDVTRLHADQAR